MKNKATTPTICQRDDWVDLKGPFTLEDVRQLKRFGDINKLAVFDQPLLTTAVARGFSELKSVRWFWLWCDVKRAAMRYIISIPGLQELDVQHIKAPGKLTGFTETSLATFRCNWSLDEHDLIEIASCKSLKNLGAQSSQLTLRAFKALLKLSHLQSLDIEATKFNDTMAALVSASPTIESLDIGATRITRKGLKHLCRMKQLRSLDLWACDITETDIDLLADLPNLEYLSIGEVGEKKTFNAATLIPRLYAIPSLKRIWLDGVRVSAEQKGELEKRYQYARVDCD